MQFAFSARWLQAEHPLLLRFVLECAAWRCGGGSRGRVTGEEQSTPAPPCPMQMWETQSQLLSAWLTLNDLITCCRLEQLYLSSTYVNYIWPHIFAALLIVRLDDILRWLSLLLAHRTIWGKELTVKWLCDRFWSVEKFKLQRSVPDGGGHTT